MDQGDKFHFWEHVFYWLKEVGSHIERKIVTERNWSKHNKMESRGLFNKWSCFSSISRPIGNYLHNCWCLSTFCIETRMQEVIFFPLLWMNYIQHTLGRQISEFLNELLRIQVRKIEIKGKACHTSFSLNIGIWTNTFGKFLFFSRSFFMASRLYLVYRFLPKHLIHAITIAM